MTTTITATTPPSYTIHCPPASATPNMPGRSLLSRARCASNRQDDPSSFFPTSDLIRSLSEPTPSLHSTGAPLVLHRPVHQWVDEPEEDESWLPGAWGSDMDEDGLLDADLDDSGDDFFGMEAESPAPAAVPSPLLALEADYPPSHSPQHSSDLELTPCHSLLTTPTFSDASTPTMPLPIPIPGSPSSSCSESHTPRSHRALPMIIPGSSSPSHMHDNASLFLTEEEEAAFCSPGSYASYASSSASYAPSLAPSSLCSWSASPSTHSAFRRSGRLSSADTISDYTPSAEWSDSASDASADEDDEDNLAQMTSGLVRFSLDTFSCGKRQGSGGMPPMVVDSVSPCSTSPYLTTPPELWEASVGGQEGLGDEQTGKKLGMSIPMRPSPLGRQPSLSI
ncbi:hypothetical protein IAT38_002978 [Cryptococcus sp. DSM 104549]